MWCGWQLELVELKVLGPDPVPDLKHNLYISKNFFFIFVCVVMLVVVAVVATI
jgi:hypothetical protein